MKFSPRKRHRIQLPDRTLELGSRTLVMGILNVTPDSFSDGGRYSDPARAAQRAWQIAEEGADILDIGGESTRPGSDAIGADEEMRRVLPVLERLAGGYPLPISIDTSKAEVARAALAHGAGIINDVSSLQNDPRVADEVASSGAALILMHMRGTPAAMQMLPPSPNILRELDLWAEEAVARARSHGVSSEKIILDPGIGFGKSAGQNLEILRNLSRLAATGFPLLVGTSRKSFIGAILDRPAADRIWGTAATVALSIVFGAHIVRVHDVAAMRDAARIADAVVNATPLVK
jgi:dihydropteroate synthase